MLAQVAPRESLLPGVMQQHKRELSFHHPANHIPCELCVEGLRDFRGVHSAGLSVGRGAPISFGRLGAVGRYYGFTPITTPFRSIRERRIWTWCSWKYSSQASR